MNFGYKKTASDGWSLSEAVEKIERLSEPAQRVLKDVLRAQKAGYKSRGVSTDCLGELILSGLAIDVGGVIFPAEDMRRSRRAATSYLRRKFDDDEYLDPDSGEFVLIPHGAEFVACAGLDGVRCRMVFPNDEITELLDLYEVNRLGGSR